MVFLRRLEAWRCAAFLLSLIYLVFELSFSARLLDIVGSPGRVEQSDIDRIEAWGRFLFGIALALMIWSLWLLPEAARRRWDFKSIVALGASAGLSVLASWLVQEVIVRALVDGSTARGRQAAVWMASISAELLNGCVPLGGVDDQARLFTTPEGKTLLALLPIAASGLDNLGGNAQPIVSAVVRNRVQDRSGSPSDAWPAKWLTSRRIVEGWARDYGDANRRYNSALDDIPRLRRKAVAQYEAKLAENRLRPGSIRPHLFPRIRQTVQTELGIPVGPSWDPNKPDELARMVEQSARAQAHATWKDTLSQRKLNDSLRPGLTIIEFFLHEEIQREWTNLLGLTSRPVLDPRYEFEQWRKLVWDIEIKSLVDNDIAVYTANLKEYEDGGRYEEHGRAAFKAVVVPPLALLFSLLGAIAHIAKIAASIIGFFWKGRVAVYAAVGVYLLSFIALLFLPFSRENDATKSDLFKRMETITEEAWGYAAARMMRGLIQAEPIIYAGGDWLRRNALNGFHYGVSDQAMIGAQPASWCQGTRVAGPVGGKGAPSAVSPSPPRPPSLQAPPADRPWLRGPAQCGGVPILAHRGVRPSVENTLEAVQAVRGAGYQGAEIDIQRTRDGNWVLHHDLVTGRVVEPARNPSLISQLTLEEWRSARMINPSGQVVSGTPSVFAAVVSSVRPRPVNMEIEIKAEANCAEVDEAMRLAAPLGAAIRWTTAFRGVATCLSEAIDRQDPGMGAQYVGLIIGPPEGSKSPEADYQLMVLKWWQKRGDLVKQDWNKIANREFASPAGVRLAANLLGKAPHRGLHFPGTDLERHPALPRAVMAAKMRYSLYGDRGDEHLAKIVRGIAPDDLNGLDALVIDGPVDPFCRAAFPGR